MYPLSYLIISLHLLNKISELPRLIEVKAFKRISSLFKFPPMIRQPLFLCIELLSSQHYFFSIYLIHHLYQRSTVSHCCTDTFLHIPEQHLGPKTILWMYNFLLVLHIVFHSIRISILSFVFISHRGCLQNSDY